jgi:hypothetical protein
VRAHAFTSGAHVVFQDGGYDGASAAGKAVLAHELAHVIQQRHGPVSGTATGDGRWRTSTRRSPSRSGTRCGYRERTARSTRTG